MLDNKFQESQEKGYKTSFFRSMPKPQRAAFLLLSALSLGVLVLWIWQFNYRLSSPFSVPGVKNNQEALDDYKMAIINVDTDGDGLTDSEENSLYNTSPYLEDSDSDGINDREEIERGSDPNCATGENCNAVEQTSSSTAPAVQNTEDSDLSGASFDNEDSLQSLMSGQASAADLRSMLLDSGVDKDALSQLSDEELIAEYKNMLSAQENATNSEPVSSQ